MADRSSSHQSPEQVTVLVGANLLFYALVAGVVPTMLRVGDDLLDRSRLEVGDGEDFRVPTGCVAMQVAASDWSAAQEHGLVPVHDVRRFVFADDQKMDQLRSNMSPELGFPAHPPAMTVSGHREDQESEENRDPSEMEADSVSFVNSELGADAAMALSLLGCLRDLAVDLRPSLAGMGAGRFGAVDRSAVVRYLAALGGVAEPAVRAVLEWAEQEPTRDASPMARLGDVVELLRSVDDPELRHLMAFQENVRGILEGEVLADAKLLSDDGSVFLRGIAALFRPKDMKYHSVVEFLDQQGGVGPRVRVLATVLSAVTTGGFKSIAGPFKTDRDLFALGCCIAAGQCHRVTIEESRGERGFEIQLDGEVLGYFQDLDAMQADRSDWQPLNLLAAAQHAGYDRPSLVVVGQPELLDESTQKQRSQYQLPGDVIVEFEPDDRDRFMSFFVEVGFPKKSKWNDKIRKDLYPRLLEDRIGGEVVLEYPTIRLYRDHHGRDLNHEELVGHVESLKKGAARLEKILRDVVPQTSKKNATKKPALSASPTKPDSKSK